MRIWWQSFVARDQNAPYLERLEDYLAEIAPDGVDVDVVDMSPPDRWFSRLTELRCGVLAVDNALEAASRGYDAFVFGHFQEPCLAEARSSVAIPVIGLGEASLRRASRLGRSLLLVSIDPVFIDYHWEQVARCGLSDRTAGVVGLGARVEDFAPAFAGDTVAYGALVGQFRRLAEPFVDKGVDVIVPAGGLFSLLIAKERDFRVDGAVVVNCIRVALEQAVSPRAEEAAAGDLPPEPAISEFRRFVASGRGAGKG
ncbi:MAG TPA: aspartate/glutamate racemase family protein [Gaiellaceae bacterium]|nr:aspartate/glutamate racemase family protein [Gaiellaceae bacterium]